MKRTVGCLVILLLALAPAYASRSSGGPVELTLHPAKTPEPMPEYRLLPKTYGQTDGDAVPLYEKAAQSLPKNLDMDQIRQWVNTPPDKLPRQQVQATLENLKPTLQLVEQAIRCKPQTWPQFVQGTLPPNLTEYKELGQILAVQARLQIAEGQYEQAIGTAQTGLAMAKHVGESPTVMQGMTGVAIAALMCRQLEQFVQGREAPSIHRALQKLPKPLVDLEKPIAVEMSNLESNSQYNVLVRRAMKRQLESSHVAVRLTMSRLDRHVAALQCVEALRLYAGAHGGKFPNELSEITEVPVPVDPVEQKPFVYRRTGSNATLEAPAPKGAEARFALRYSLNLTE